MGGSFYLRLLSVLTSVLVSRLHVKYHRFIPPIEVGLAMSIPPHAPIHTPGFMMRSRFFLRGKRAHADWTQTRLCTSGVSRSYPSPNTFERNSNRGPCESLTLSRSLPRHGQLNFRAQPAVGARRQGNYLSLESLLGQGRHQPNT